MAGQSRKEVKLPSLQMGMGVHISRTDGKFKYMTRLVGVDQDRSLITTLPSAAQLKKTNVDYAELLPAGCQLVMRLVLDGDAYAFQNTVISIVDSPNKLLFSTYPEAVQTRPLRKEQRFPCTLLASLDGQPGLLTNISRHGCQFQAQVSATNFAEIGPSQDPLKLTIRFPLKEDRSLIIAHVMSKLLKNETWLIGLSFNTDVQMVDQFLEAMQLEDLVDFF